MAVQSDSGGENPSLSPDKIERRAAEKMHGILYTYKTHYKMGKACEKANTFLDYSVAVLTAVLAVLLVWGAAESGVLIGIAMLTSLISWASSVANLGVKSRQHYEEGDAYHSLFSDFRDFVTLDVSEEEKTLDSKRESLDELTQKRRNLKRNTPRTTNFWYKCAKKSDVLNGIETDEEERKLFWEKYLLTKINARCRPVRRSGGCSAC